MTELQSELLAIADGKYADFQVKLAPGISRENVLGVRLPALRAFAKEFSKSDRRDTFLQSLPHTYYDENMLHSILISMIKDPELCIAEVERFLPYIDNWAVCDTLHPAVFKKHKEQLLNKSLNWIKSPETFICRFGVNMLMTYFLDKDFDPEYPKRIAAIESEAYYVRMMVAWYFATALAKQWDAVIPYIENRQLEKRTHLKTIQKAVESFRITDDQKEYLKSLRY